jgi:hypothetical protein
MQLRRSLAAMSLIGAMAVALSASGCPGETSEEILYCFVLNALTGGEHGLEDCYIYEIPEDRALARYEDDLRAYQAMVEFSGATGPAVPTPAEFMASRYPDWPTRAAALRVTLGLDSAVVSPIDQ